MPRRDFEQNKEWRRQNSAKHRAENTPKALKLLGGQCSTCSTVEGLQFHHVNPSTKKFNIGSRMKGSWEILLPELEKCILLCETCHRGHHAAKHGTHSRYTAGCRCDECRKVATEYYRKYWSKKKAKKKHGLIA